MTIPLGRIRHHPAGLPERLGVDRCLVMGVLNVTPDSFSDGGRWDTVEAAVAQGIQMVGAGADIVDVGGESTRPGAEQVPVSVELERTVPVVQALASQGICVSVDTMRAPTAHAALEAGATIVNDVSGGLADPEMASVVAAHDGPYVVMHWRAHSIEMARWTHYDDVVTEVVEKLAERVAAAESAGITRDRLVIDPGLGFAKEPGHNWILLRALNRLISGDLPVLVGASRKRFLGELLGDERNPRDISGRDAATHATSALAAAAGVWCVRVHDVAGTADAVRVARAWTGE